MKYVLDSCVAFKWSVVESETAEARRLRDDYLRAVVELIAPDVFPLEISHALTRAERQKRITAAESAQFLRDLIRAIPLLYPSFPLLARAHSISSALRVGVYDCLYVAHAEREGCDLVTADVKLLRTLGPHFPFIIPLA